MSKPTVNVITADDGTQFGFGEATPVLAENLADYTGVFANWHGDYYNAPVSRTGLAKLWRANGHHESAIGFKQNMMIKHLKPSALLNRKNARYAALDYQIFGEMNFQAFRNAFGDIVRLKRLPVINMRRRLDGRFCLLTTNHHRLGIGQPEYTTFKHNEVLQICQADVTQDIYGLPHYLGGMQSVLLSEAATLFRRNYYINGNHAGYIMVTWDMPEAINKDLVNKMKAGKAPGNFSNYYIGGKSKPGQRGENLKDKVQILPIGEVGQKDDYDKIKRMTLLEIFGMHRIQPALAAMMPDANGGFGDIEKISRVNYENEVIPMQQVMEELNDHLPRSGWLQFNEPAFLKE